MTDEELFASGKILTRMEHPHRKGEIWWAVCNRPQFGEELFTLSFGKTIEEAIKAAKEFLGRDNE